MTGDHAATALSHVLQPPSEDAPERLRHAVLSSIGESFIGGNSVAILRNGAEIFPAMLGAVRQARKTIVFVTFVFWSGDIADEFAHALAERARAGVRVRVVLDGFGSRPMDSGLLDMMADAGVEVERFRPVRRWKFWEADHRTHRKILVVDDRIGFTGGVGIASEWTGNGGEPGAWRDTHFQIRGPALMALRAVFLTDWRDAGHGIDEFDMDVEEPDDAGDVDLAVIDGSAQIGVNDAGRVLEALVASARHRILIQTPYFNPVGPLTERLFDAMRRGVEIDLLLPGPHIDKAISRIRAEGVSGPLAEAGMRIWVYQPTMMHVKAVMIDGAMSLVGSVNVNRRSIEKDEEVALAVGDVGITSALEEDFLADAAESLRSGDVDGWAGRSHRMMSALLRPIRGEL